MVQFTTPLSIWVQLGNLCFLLVGLFSDLLLIRGLLVVGFGFYAFNACLGAPLWPNLYNPGVFAISDFIWFALNLYVHSAGMVQLLLDERHVDFTEEEDALWRLFYRMGGCSKRVFKAVVVGQHMKVKHYKKGDFLPDSEKFVHILYKGNCQLQLVTPAAAGSGMTEVISHERIVVSGRLFHFKHLQLLQTTLDQSSLRVQALTDNVVVFEFPAEVMPKVVSQNPTIQNVWQLLMMDTISQLADAHVYGVSKASSDRPEHNRLVPSSVLEEYVDPRFTELQEYEMPPDAYAGSGRALRKPLNHLVETIKMYFAPPWPIQSLPPGIRHQMMSAPPPSPPPSQADIEKYNATEEPEFQLAVSVDSHHFSEFSV